MPSERVFSAWSLMLLVVPLAAARLGCGESRLDRYFIGSCVPVTLLLLGFLPRVTFTPVQAVGATFGFGGMVALAYLLLVPLARKATLGLLVVIGVVDVAALATVYLSGDAALGAFTFSLLLLGVTAGTAWAGVSIVKRFDRAAPSARDE